MNSTLRSNDSRRSVASKCLLGLALAACALLGASASDAAPAAPCRPVHLDGAGQFSDRTFDGSGNLASARISGSGQLSHLGSFTATGMDTFGAPHDGVVLVDGTGVLEAANGDHLDYSFAGAVYHPSAGTSTGRYVFSGGTGRFAGASGTADFASTPDPTDPAAFGISATGTLCY